MTTYEIELDGYDTDDGKKPLLIVNVEEDDDDIYISGHSVTDSIALTDKEVYEFTESYIKARFKPEFS